MLAFLSHRHSGRSSGSRCRASSVASRFRRLLSPSGKGEVARERERTRERERETERGGATCRGRKEGTERGEGVEQKADTEPLVQLMDVQQREADVGTITTLQYPT